MTTTIEGVRILLNSIKSSVERLTSGNVSHCGQSIKLTTENAISIYEEALKEQQEIDIERAWKHIEDWFEEDEKRVAKLALTKTMKGE